MQSKYADDSNVVGDIVSLVPHGVGVEASFPLGRDLFRWRQSKTGDVTLPIKAAVRQFAQANDGISAGANPESSTTETGNDSEMKQQAEIMKRHRMANLHDFLEKWQRSQNLCATQKESCAQIKLMNTVGYILDTEEIVKASWSLIHHDCAAAITLLE